MRLRTTQLAVYKTGVTSVGMHPHLQIRAAERPFFLVTSLFLCLVCADEMCHIVDIATEVKCHMQFLDISL